MRFIDLYVALLAIGGTSALPSTTNSQTVSVKAEYNPDHKFDFVRAQRKAYGRHGYPKSWPQAKRQGKRQNTGSEPNHPGDSLDDEYISVVDIGTPAKKFPLDFDTGSSDLWVYSTEQPSSQNQGQVQYDPSKSSTSKKLSGYSWTIEYGDHSGANGDVYTDAVTVGGLKFSTQAVEAAQSVSAQFVNDTANSGLLGLAFDSINTVSPRSQKTWFSNVKSRLKSPLFTATLRHQADGVYNFGFIDPSLYTGSITYTSLDSSQGFWGFTSSGYAVGSGGFKSSRISGILDTGTTLLYVPSSITNAYYAKVSGHKIAYDDNGDPIGIVFPCSGKLPDYTFGVGSSRYVIPGSGLNFGPYEDGSDFCVGGIQEGSDPSIFGDVILKQVFAVFDDGNSRIGFAKTA